MENLMASTEIDYKTITEWSEKERQVAKAARNELIREKLIDKFSEPECVNWLKFGGLISMGVNLNLKRRCGERLTIMKNLNFQIGRARSWILYLLFVIVTVRQFLLIFLGSPNAQLWLGDMTRFWPGRRLNYLFASFMLSLNLVLTFYQFNAGEKKLYWHLPFLSLKMFYEKYGPLKNNHAEPFIDGREYKRSLDFFHYFICSLACFLSGSFGYLLIRMANDNYKHNGMLILPWIIISVLWLFFLIYNSYAILAYYYLVTMAFNERFKANNLEISTILDLPDEEVTEIRAKNVVLSSLNHVRMVIDSDKFWGRFIYFTFLCYFTCAGYMLYHIIYTHNGLIFLIFHLVILLHCTGHCLAYFYCSVTMAESMNEPTDDLGVLLNKPYTNEIFSELVLLQCCLSNEKYGISCGNLFKITLASASIILALVSTSFLIATDYSQSNVTCEICKHYAQVYDWLLNTTSL